MQFSIEKEKFLKILLLISHQILLKPALPILANIQLKAEKNQLTILATNLELGSIFTLEAKVKKPGEITIPAKTLTEFISTINEDELSFELENSEIKIKSTNSSASLPTISAEEYPQIPKISKTITEITGKNLLETITRTVFAAAVDSVRPILTGVLVEFGKSGISFVATDGYRLSFEEIAGKTQGEPRQIVIPAKTLTQLSRVSQEFGKTIKILHDPTINQIGFETEGVSLVSRLTDGNFPDWQKIIPVSFKTHTTVSKTELLQVVKTGSVFAKDAGNVVKLRFSKSGISVNTQSSQGASLSIAKAKVTGEELEIAFNWRYLTEALQAMPADLVNIELVENLAPAKLTPVQKDSSFFHIIMPVRI